MNAKLKPDLSVATHDDRIVITQKRHHKSGPNKQHYTVSLTAPEARRVAEALQRNASLLEALERKGLL